VLRRGHRLIAFSRDGRAPGPATTDCLPLPLDLGDPSSVEAAARRANGQRIDVLIHNAAIRGDTGGLPDFTQAELCRVMAVNVAGPLLLTRALLRRLAPDATVAFVSSRAGSCAEGADPDGDYAYCLSKAALNRAMAKLADDLPFRFLSIHPGWLRSAMGGPEAPEDPAVAARDMVDLLLARPGVPSGWFGDARGRAIAW
jgi:NAD(P)-dependent dehydrogenase (short-subunit alcohol dehydrogenase family)